MGLNIDLVVHGVPMGQKMWGAKHEEELFFSSFYGAQWQETEVLRVETQTFGNVTNCYYSFVKGNGVCDSNGRSGSYFALTLRMNCFYADVQNLYNILKAAYAKMCVGMCLQESNGVLKYTVSDFSSKENDFLNLQKQLRGYIENFSVESDLMSLAEFNKASTGNCISLKDCVKANALKLAKLGSFKVSAYYLSMTDQNTLNKYKTELDSTKKKASEELDAQRQSYQSQIAEQEKKFNSNIEIIRKENADKLREKDAIYKTEIEKLNSHYANSAATIKKLEQDYAILKKERDSLSHEVQVFKAKPKSTEFYLREIDNKLDNLKYSQKRNFEEEESGGSSNRSEWIFKGLVLLFLIALLVLSALNYSSSGENKKSIDDTTQSLDSPNEAVSYGENSSGQEGNDSTSNKDAKSDSVK